MSEDSAAEWIELFPHGISVGSSLGRPVLILKDHSALDVLPVWMNSLDAGVVLADLANGSSGASPHVLTRRILDAVNLSVDSCTFVELIGHHQYVLLKLKPTKTDSVSVPGPSTASGWNEKTLRIRAEDAMSFCLQSRARFFSTRAYMARCRDLDADLSRLEKGLAAGVLPGFQGEREFSSKKHPYVM